MADRPVTGAIGRRQADHAGAAAAVASDIAERRRRLAAAVFFVAGDAEPGGHLAERGWVTVLVGRALDAGAAGDAGIADRGVVRTAGDGRAGHTCAAGYRGIADRSLGAPRVCSAYDASASRDRRVANRGGAGASARRCARNAAPGVADRRCSRAARILDTADADVQGRIADRRCCTVGRVSAAHARALAAVGGHRAVGRGARAPLGFGADLTVPAGQVAYGLRTVARRIAVPRELREATAI
jgi:hypothetical protein